MMVFSRLKAQVQAAGLELDVIWFDDSKKEKLQSYLNSKEMMPYMHALERTTKLIDGFESPFGMELLATTDWLITKEHCETTIESLIEGMKHWTGGSQAAKRKASLFDARSISIALDRLNQVVRQDTMIKPEVQSCFLYNFKGRL